MCVRAHAVKAVAWLQMWAGEYDGPHAALVASLLRSGEAKTLAKATCEGLGGGFTAIKKAGCGAAGYGAGFGVDGCATAAGEEGFNALEGAQGILLHSALPVSPNPPASESCCVCACPCRRSTLRLGGCLVAGSWFQKSGPGARAPCRAGLLRFRAQAYALWVPIH